jgi:hypothetical protein
MPPRSLTLPLPLDAAAWRLAFGQVRKFAEPHYDEAHACVLEFDADALGRARVLAERDFTPLRWVVRGGNHVALIDSQGHDDLAVSTYCCGEPWLGKSINTHAAIEGIEISDDGALVVARSRDLEAAIVVVPPQRITNFAGLSQQPSVKAIQRDSRSISDLVRLGAAWERARLAAGSLTEIRRTAAVEALLREAIGTICGERWANAEVLLADGANRAASSMRSLISSRPDERGVAAVLAREATTLARCPQTEADEALLKSIRTFVKGNYTDALVRFALRLAASPQTAMLFVDESETGHPDELLRSLLEGLLANPVVLRAARYFLVETRAVIGLSIGMLSALPWSRN